MTYNTSKLAPISANDFANLILFCRDGKKLPHEEHDAVFDRPKCDKHKIFMSDYFKGFVVWHDDQWLRKIVET